jgi:hypothetical protein
MQGQEWEAVLGGSLLNKIGVGVTVIGVALIPLSLSLLWVAQRFGWNAMAVLGAPVTYCIYLAAVAHSRGGSLAAAQTVLLIYWAAFEAFDVLDAARRSAWRGWVHALLPLNACGLLTASSVIWTVAAPGKIHQFLAIVAAAYLVSAVVRSRVLRPAGFPAEAGWIARVWAGGYEPAAALAALLAAVGIGAGCEKTLMSFAWLAPAAAR